MDITYTHDTLEDVTKWYPDADGFTDEVKGWEDEKRLVLYFEVYHAENVIPASTEEVVRCLACLNVDQDS